VSFLLDTNICSMHLRRSAGLSHRFIQHSGRLHLPTIELGELYTWAYRRADPRPLLLLIEHELLSALNVLTYDSICAERFGIERAGLLRKGIVVDPADLMIASVALVHDLTLVTHNTADFQQIPNLRLEDWLSE
jgi:tRNA(fMet)-specific endonuclease VapC